MSEEDGNRDTNGGPRRRAEAGLRRSEGFEATDRGYRVATTAIDAVVSVSIDQDNTPVYRVTVTAPTIDAVVVDESVADVIVDGWADTFERRLVDPHQVGRGLEPIEPIVLFEGDTVTVRLRFADRDPSRAAENARALAEFVEGTWVQGLIPGYEYRDPAASLLEKATNRYGGDEPSK